MPRGSQVYRLRSNSARDIHSALNELTGKRPNTYPRINDLLLDRQNNQVTGIIHAETFDGGDVIHPVYDFVFDIESSSCYMIGNTLGRDSTANVLSRQIDPNNDGVISPLELTNENILNDIFSILRNEDQRNFIKKMKLKFGTNGLVYGSETTPLYELDYRFIGNICASTHIDFHRFVGGAIHIGVNFGIWRLGSIENSQKPTTLRVAKDYSFGLWLDLPSAEWIEILDTLTSF